MKKTLSFAPLCVGLFCACGAAEQGVGATLTIPVGSYAGCTENAVNVTPGEVAVTGGGSGTVTLSANGDGRATAVLAFQGLPTETVAFSPASSTSAGFTAGPLEPLDAGDGPATTLPVAAGSLALVGDTLLISAYGQGDDTRISSFYSCPLPSSLPGATFAIPTPTTGSIPTGTYGACMTSFGSNMGGYTLGGGVSLTIAETDTTLTVASVAGFGLGFACDLAFHDMSGSTATLSDGQTCPISEPCGPGPTMGQSSAPNEATLTNLTGSIELVGGVLFLNVVGDAPSAACGSHTLSIICPVGP